MTRSKRCILMIGLALMVLALLFPPAWYPPSRDVFFRYQARAGEFATSLGRTTLFSTSFVAYRRLLAELGLVAALTAIAWLVACRPDRARQRG